MCPNEWEANAVKDFWPHFIIVQMERLHHLTRFARSPDLSVCAHLPPSARGPSPGDGGGGGAASLMSLMRSQIKTPTYSVTSIDIQRQSEVSALLVNQKVGGGLCDAGGASRSNQDSH